MSNFKGYLFKIEGKPLFPFRFIALDGYTSKPNQIMDVDPYRDLDGELHRNVLKHTATSISFVTKPLYLEEKIEMQTHLPPSRVEFNMEYWNDETNKYETGKFYMPEPEYKYYRTLIRDGVPTIQYRPITIEMIEY